MIILTQGCILWTPSMQLNVPLVLMLRSCSESSLFSWFLISRLVNRGRGLSHMRVYGRGHLCKNRTQRWAHAHRMRAIVSRSFRRVCLLPWLRCSFILGCVIIYASRPYGSLFLMLTRTIKEVTVFEIFIGYVPDLCLFTAACDAPGTVERGGRTGAVNVLGWRTIKGSSMAESWQFSCTTLDKNSLCM